MSTFFNWAAFSVMKKTYRLSQTRPPDVGSLRPRKGARLDGLERSQPVARYAVVAVAGTPSSARRETAIAPP